MTNGDDDIFGARHQSADSVSLFLALYLVVLAFFIVLVSMSTFEEGKAQAAIESVTATFSSALTPSETSAPIVETHGSFLFGRAFQEDISRSFESTLRLAEIRVVHLGREMRVTLPSNALFEPGSWRIREERLPLLDRLVTAISQHAQGGRFVVEFAIGSHQISTGDLAAGADLSALRAAAFARIMVARGAPDDQLGIALVPADPATVAMTFRWWPVPDDGSLQRLP